MARKKPVLGRFEALFVPEPNTGCWLWLGSHNGGGYGMFSAGRRMVGAHRVAYELYMGPVPPNESYHGLCVCHSCDQRSCVNPAHLFLGTQKENIQDMVRKGRSHYSRGPRPNCRPPVRAKLTLEQVEYIRRSTGSQRTIASEFGVHQSVVSRIRSGKRWSNA